MSLLQNPEIENKVTSMTCFLVCLAFDMIVELIIIAIYLRLVYNNHFLFLIKKGPY